MKKRFSQIPTGTYGSQQGKAEDDVVKHWKTHKNMNTGRSHPRLESIYLLCNYQNHRRRESSKDTGEDKQVS